MEEVHLTAAQLARRWHIEVSTLQHWRWSGKGPRFFKNNGKIVYPIKYIESFENDRLKDNTAQSDIPVQCYRRRPV